MFILLTYACICIRHNWRDKLTIKHSQRLGFKVYITKKINKCNICVASSQNGLLSVSSLDSNPLFTIAIHLGTALHTFEMCPFHGS